jgi:hypothetical protein
MSELTQFFTQKPANKVLYTTLEIYNPAAGLKRFVTGQQFDKSFKLESAAPRNPSAVVAFEPVGFEAPQPEAGEDGEVFLDVQLGAIGFEAKPYIDAVMNSWPPRIDVVWRQHLTGVEQPVAVLYFEGAAWTLDVINVGLRCEQINFASRDISLIYTPDVFKGLRGLI